MSDTGYVNEMMRNGVCGNESGNTQWHVHCRELLRMKHSWWQFYRLFSQFLRPKWRSCIQYDKGRCTWGEEGGHAFSVWPSTLGTFWATLQPSATLGMTNLPKYHGCGSCDINSHMTLWSCDFVSHRTYPTHKVMWHYKSHDRSHGLVSNPCPAGLLSSNVILMISTTKVLLDRGCWLSYDLTNCWLHICFPCSSVNTGSNSMKVVPSGRIFEGLSNGIHSAQTLK